MSVILDSRGRPVTPRAVYGYEPTSGGRRMAGWRPTQANLNTLLAGSGDLLTAQARDLVRRNTWARNAVGAWSANVVGNGIGMEPQHPDPAERARLKKLWKRFSNQADYDGRNSIYGLQDLAAREIYEGGEVLALLHQREPEFAGDFGLRIQLLEAEHLPYSKLTEGLNGNSIRLGIEFDKRGRRVAYHLYREHPGDLTEQQRSGLVERIAAEHVLHCFSPVRAGQIRGETSFAPVIVKLHELDQYDDAELLRKKFAAFLIGWTKNMTPEETAFDPESSVDGEDAPGGTGFVATEPGTILNLPPTTDLGWNQPADLGGAYEAFLNVQLRAIAVALKLAAHQLTGNVGDANYSSLRAALLEVRRLMEQFQYNVFEFQFCLPIWRRFLDAAVLVGEIDVRKFERERDEYLDVNIRPPAWPWIDPEADAKAEQLAVRSGFKARSTVIQERGEDPVEVDEMNAADNARADQLGLRYDSDGRQDMVSKPASPDQPADKSKGQAK